MMFDALEKRFKKDGHQTPNLINDLYQGTMKDYVKCLEVDDILITLSASLTALDLVVGTSVNQVLEKLLKRRLTEISLLFRLLQPRLFSLLSLLVHHTVHWLIHL